MNKIILEKWVEEALVENNGAASVLEVAKIIWNNHEEDLKASGNLFYTWQYNYRWAATNLRNKGILKPANESPNGIWELNIIKSDNFEYLK
tara:strand:- start:168 stop:440 length:273 start_codon:yes stop_codon:yes gene_type:complete